MRVLISAIGKLKASPERELFAQYIKRLPWKIECKEFEVKADDAKRKSREAEILLDACKGYEKIVALDESGKTLSSIEFANTLERWRQQGYGSVAFVIGGADGLAPQVLKSADLVWSLGRVTWPHMLTRALLAEQLYRTWSLITRHPYHRP